jgi:hypothetical protein
MYNPQCFQCWPSLICLYGSTVADLSFLTWDMMAPWVLDNKYAGLEVEKNYPTALTGTNA